MSHILKQSPKLPENTSQTDNFVNNLYDDSFTLRFTSPDPTEKEVQFTQLNNPEIIQSWKRWAMEAIVCYFGGWDDIQRQTLVQKNTSALSVCQSYFAIALFASRNYPNTQLSDWNYSHIYELLQSQFRLELLISDHARSRQNRSFPAFTVIEKTITCLRKTHMPAVSQKLTDGLMFQLKSNIKIAEQALETLVLEQGLIVQEWIKGNSYQAIDAILASTMSAYAINIIESPKVSFLCDFYRFQREQKGSLIIRHKSLSKDKSLAWAYKSSVNITNLRTPKGNKHSEQQLARKRAYYHLIEKHRTKVPPLEETGFPFLSLHEVHTEVEKVYQACYWLILTCTGIRHSEISSLNGDSYNDVTERYRTKVKKTDNSANHERGGAELISNIFMILNELSLTPKYNRADGKVLPLWAKTFKHNTGHSSDIESEAVRKGHTLPRSNKTGKAIRFGTSKKAFNCLLENFCESFADSQPLFAELVIGIHPHRLRHTYAQFILRRFEGYMHESLRIHFRHAANSSMTSVYESQKLKEDAKLANERGYIHEIVKRIYDEIEGKISIEGNEDFYGVVARRISQLLKRMNIHQPDELLSAISAISTQVESIKANNYGYCVVFKDTRAQSKCFDKQTNTPKVDSGQFDTCSGCPHFMYSKTGNKEAIINHRFLHSKQIDVYKQLGITSDSPVMQASMLAVKNAEIALDEMGVGNE